MSMDEILPDSQDAGFTEGKPQDVIIKVLGVGGGGNNAVSHMYKQNIRNVSFAVLNTDRKALEYSPVPTKIQIGNGLGAGNIPEIARKAAEDAADEISRLLDDKTKMVFITAGMGGGTGTGAAPVVARIAKEKGLLTIGIVTIPFLFEGEQKILKAINGADEMSKHVDAMLVINNQRLTDIYPDLTLVNAFAKADDTLTTAARSISELINSESPHINLDFNDVDTTLRNGGAAIISTGYGSGENRVTKAIKDALHSPLLKNRDILTSKHLLFNIFFNPDSEVPFKMEETDELTSFVSSIDSDVDVIWGMAFDRSLGDTVKITILASGFEVTLDSMKSQNNVNGTPNRRIIFGEKKSANASTSDLSTLEALKTEYGAEAAERMVNAKAKARYIVLEPSQMDDDAFIEAFEKSPTYNRDKKSSEEIKSLGLKKSAPAQPRQPQTPSANGEITAIRFS